MKDQIEQETLKNLDTKNCSLPMCCSISTMQKAIANMIDAQGEEIKKILSLPEDSIHIKDIHELINKNIYQLTIFEYSLYDNVKCCCPCANKPLRPICNCDVDGGTF